MSDPHELIIASGHDQLSMLDSDNRSVAIYTTNFETAIANNYVIVVYQGIDCGCS